MALEILQYCKAWGMYFCSLMLCSATSSGQKELDVTTTANSTHIHKRRPRKKMVLFTRGGILTSADNHDPIWPSHELDAENLVHNQFRHLPICSNNLQSIPIKPIISMSIHVHYAVNWLLSVHNHFLIMYFFLVQLIIHPGYWLVKYITIAHSPSPLLSWPSWLLVKSVCETEPVLFKSADYYKLFPHLSQEKTRM